MHIKIYQINSERDPGRAKFMGLNSVKDINPASYDEVFSGDVDCKNLEDVFTMLNTRGHPLHRGHSLSVSDVVLTEDGAYFCDTIGFKDINFDESKAHKPDELLKIVYVEPNRPPFVSEVGDDRQSSGTDQSRRGAVHTGAFGAGKGAWVCDKAGRVLCGQSNGRAAY